MTVHSGEGVPYHGELLGAAYWTGFECRLLDAKAVRSSKPEVKTNISNTDRNNKKHLYSINSNGDHHQIQG